MRSTAAIISAAAASASRRIAIGTVPACPASPFTCARARVMPAIAETMPTARSFDFELRALLDVHLEIGDDVHGRGRAPRRRRVAAEG